MGGPTPDVQKNPEADGARAAAAMADVMPAAEQLSTAESDERSREIEATFDKIAGFHDRAESMQEVERAASIASIVKIDKQLNPMNAEMERLLEEKKSAKTQEAKDAVNEKMTALEAKMSPLVTQRREKMAKYNGLIDTLTPALAKTVSDGGSGNATIAAKFKKGVNVYENLREANNALQLSPPPTGLGLAKDDLMANRSKLEQKSQEYWKASPQAWAAFQKKIDSIDKAFIDAKTGVEAAKRSVA